MLIANPSKHDVAVNAPARHFLHEDISWRQNAMRLLFVFFLTFITVLSLIPAPASDSSGSILSQWLANLFLGTGEHADKVTHFIAYAVLTGTGMLGRLRIKQRYRWFALAICAWSGLLEIGQYITGYRFLDGIDFLANIMGALTGAVAGFVVLSVYDTYRKRGTAKVDVL